MKIFTGAQIGELDRYTIEHETITSLDLMERAAKVLTNAVTERWNNSTPIVVLAGPGNNGGDALAMARLLAERDYSVSVYLFNIHNRLSEECSANAKRVAAEKRIEQFTEVSLNFEPPVLTDDTLVIDGLFGAGLNKPLAGGFASLVKYVNQSPSKVVSIDIPSGLLTEDNTYSVQVNIIKADLTLTIQSKKLSMMFADNQQYIGELCVLDIGLSKDYLDKTDVLYSVVEESDIRSKIKRRDDFAHKGTMGNALIIAGSYGMAGAAVLATKSCLRSGVGKVIVHAPKCNYNIMQISVPEAVTQIDPDESYFSEPVITDGIDAIGIGPGLGKQENTAIAMIAQITKAQCPLVIDADALNLLATHKAWLQQLPKGTILTPHPKEFDGLDINASSSGDYERLHKAQDMASRMGIFIILKGHYSALCMPDGNVIFNSTGNPGMATAGCGDVLTGIITALLARGYERSDAALLGMYLHGLAGDLAAEEVGEESLVASDIIEYLPKAFKRLND